MTGRFTDKIKTAAAAAPAFMDFKAEREEERDRHRLPGKKLVLDDE